MPAIFAITENGGIYYKYNVIQCLLYDVLLLCIFLALKKNSMKQILALIIFYLALLPAQAQQYPSGINVAAKAPQFEAKDQNGNNVQLNQLLKKGTVVLIFYRGQWCPHCNRQLKQLEDSLNFLKEKGASLVAITPEKPENIKKTMAKTKASYPILFDEGLKIMKQYEVAYDVDAVTIDKYKKYGIDFNEVNGNNGAVLPVPAVYIINKTGEIVYKFFDTNYTKRPSVKELLGYL